MQVKLAFSVATSVESEILIVDEVLAVGDLAFQQKCIERMEKLIKGDSRTVIIVGHNIRQIQQICNRVMLLDHGRISRDGNPSEVCSIFYDEAHQRNIARHIFIEGEVTPQQDIDIIKVKKIELLDDDNNLVNHIGLHEPMKIRVVFECTKNIQRPEIVVGLHTSDFFHVLSVGNALSDTRPDFAPGIHQFVCRISDIPLRPANYVLRLGFLDQHRHVIWYAENIRPVQITQGNFDITKLPEAGLVDVPAQWSYGDAQCLTPNANLSKNHVKSYLT